MHSPTFRSVIAGLAFVFAGSVSALAADAQAFGNRLKEVATAGSMPLNFAGAEAQGDNVVLKGVTFGQGPDAAKLGDVTFESVTGSDAEGWKVARVPFADVDTVRGDGNRLNVTGMAVTGLQIAQKEGTSKLPGESAYFFDSASVNGLKVSRDDKDMATIGATTFVNAVGSDGAITSKLVLGDFKLDFLNGKDEKAAQTMQAIGYPQVTGDGAVDMAWNPKTGDTGIDPLRITAKDAGELMMTYKIGGYTPAFVKSLAAVQQQMIANPDQSQSAGMAIIGLMSQLSVQSMHIAFTDDSLTGKLLDYFAKKNGQSREQLVSDLSQTSRQMLAGLNNPKFQGQVGDAVATYLKDPKSISISVDPASPIPAAQILGAAMAAPQTLPDVLQVRVTANDETTDEPEAGAATPQ